MISWQTYYRPKKFTELALPDVRDQMETMRQAANFPRVMLFTGPKGTGKTSTSRILAATLNSPVNRQLVRDVYLSPSDTTPTSGFADPQTDNDTVAEILAGNSFAVVELDAASHRGIDDVRSLQEQVYLPPQLADVLVYILDEVHMFTTEAFNALLKVLEEPPAHAFFILATTEYHKIPATVVSRCRVINFRRATENELITAFDRILVDQHLTAEPAVLQEIARLADGSFRDGVKFLQTVHEAGGLTLANVQKTLIGSQQSRIKTLIDIILQKDSQALIKFFGELRQQGVDERYFLQNFYRYLYDQLVTGLTGSGQPTLNDKQAKFLLKNLLNVTGGDAIPFLGLELAILEIFDHAAKNRKD